ncbi:MAG: hypothetical protein ACI39E_07890 [Acutalibacteraceae bacterium]
MAKETYSVDDILLEYELKKQQASRGPAQSAAETFSAPKTAAPPKAPMPVKPTAPAANPAERSTVRFAVPPEASGEKPKKAKPLTAVDKFGGAKAVPAVGVTPLNTAAPAKQAAQTRTRILSVTPREETHNTQELPPAEQLDGQMVFEQFAQDEADEETLEEQLRARRMKKVNDFQLIKGGQDTFRLTGEEEEENEPDEEPAATEDEDELEDFNEYAEAEAIRSELSYRRRMGFIGVLATAVMELLLFAAQVCYSCGLLSVVAPPLLIAFNGVLLLGMMAINHRLVGNGLRGFFTFRSDADAPPAVLALFGALYTVWQFFQIDTVAQGGASLLTAVAGLGLLLGAMGRQTRTVRICRNFAFVGSSTISKYAAQYIEDDRIASELGRLLDADGVPEVAYYKKVSFLSRFLERSYAPDFGDRAMRWFVPLCTGVALLCAGGYAWLTPQTALSVAPIVFMSALCLSMPAGTLLAIQRPITRVCSRLLRRGAMLSGWQSAEYFGDRPHALVMDAQDIFPSEQVKLHGIKTFSGTRIDEAITDAAAVVIGAGGPLSPIFHRVIENRTDILQEADSLAYEQDMGLSGWVGGRRVLVGNRRLLENHGVEVPPRDYEERYTKNGRCAVYLSTGGELSAMFVVSYLAEKTVCDQLLALQREKISLLIRTCDPNISVARVCEVMGLDAQYVQVMSASDGRTYETLVAEESGQRAEALLASNGRAVGRMAGLVQSSRLLRGGRAAVILQIVGGILGMAFSAFVSATTGLVLSPTALIGYMCGVGLLSLLIPRCFKA